MASSRAPPGRNKSETAAAAAVERVSHRGTDVAYLTSFPGWLSIAVDFGVARRVILGVRRCRVVVSPPKSWMTRVMRGWDEKRCAGGATFVIFYYESDNVKLCEIVLKRCPVVHRRISSWWGQIELLHSGTFLYCRL